MTLREEVQRTLDNQLSALDDIDTKAMAILRVNIILLGLLLTLLSLAADPGFLAGPDPRHVAALTNSYMFVGIVSLLFSTALAALTYTASDADVGIEYEKIHAVIDADLTEREFEIAAAQTYGHWIRYNRRTNKLNSLLITLTSILAIVVIANLSLAVYSAFVDQYTGMLVLITWLLLGRLAWMAGLPAQVRSALGVINEERRS